MSDQGVLRLWSLRPQVHSSIVDARLREVIGAGAETAGLIAQFVGRRVVDRAEERVVATVWESGAAVEAAVAPGGLLAFETELGAGVVETMSIVLAIRPEMPAMTPREPGVLLRVFRGHARSGELDVYVDAARRGTLEDIARSGGPICLFLGVPEPDRFVTVSAWTDWERIQTATGGNVQHPITTQHIGHLVGGLVAHYEILPAGQAPASAAAPEGHAGSGDGAPADSRAGAADDPGPDPGLRPELTLAD